MSPLELGSTIGAALAGGGAVIIFITRVWKNGNKNQSFNYLHDAAKEQIEILREIRDSLMKLGFQFDSQHDKLIIMNDSIKAVHKRLDE